MKSNRIVVIGGGIVGLTIAWRLQQGGASVTVLERENAAGLEASWAAAGMLSPFGENHSEGPMLEFGVQSLEQYPSFLSELTAETGYAPELCGPGMMRLVFSDSDLEARRKSALLATRHNHASQWLSGDQVRALEPGVSSECIGGVLSPDEVHLDPRLLCEAVRQAAVGAGVSILPHAEACSFELSPSAVTGLRVNDERILADTYVVAAGAWSGKFARQLGLDVTIFPRKGQMIRVRPVGGVANVRYTLYMHSTYLVPRDDTVIVGATQEEVGFDRSLGRDVAADLLNSAVAIVPGLQDAEVLDHWMGFRPATADTLPIIGFAPEHPNVYFATAHLRNGILLAPVTAKVALDDILHDVHAQQWSAFLPSRFWHTN